MYSFIFTICERQERLVTLAKYSLVFTFMVTIWLGMLGQNVKADLMQLNQFYEGKPIATEMRLEIYPSYQSSQIAGQYESVYQKDGKKLYYKFGENEIVRTEEFALLINHDHKTMMIQPRIEAPVTDLAATIDSLLAKASKTNYTTKGDLIRYSFHFNAGPYPRIDLEFDRKTWIIKRLIHYYKRGAYNGVKGVTKDDAVRSELVYTDTRFEVDTSTEKSFFSEKRFMKLEKGQYHVLPEYASYRLFDFIHLN